MSKFEPDTANTARQCLSKTKSAVDSNGVWTNRPASLSPTHFLPFSSLQGTQDLAYSHPVPCDCLFPEDFDNDADDQEAFDHEAHACPAPGQAEIWRDAYKLFARVAYARCYLGRGDESGSSTPATPQPSEAIVSLAKRLENRYGQSLLARTYNDWHWGQLNGKLDALRWVLGEEWNLRLIPKAERQITRKGSDKSDPDSLPLAGYAMRGHAEIGEAEEEFGERIWYYRCHLRTLENYKNGTVRPSAADWQKTVSAGQAVRKTWGKRKVEGPYSDFEWGVLNGKLDALRWALGTDEMYGGWSADQ